MRRPVSRFLKNKHRRKEPEVVSQWSSPSLKLSNDVHVKSRDERKERRTGDAQSELSRLKDEEFVKRIGTRLSNLSSTLAPLKPTAALSLYQPTSWSHGTNVERELLRSQLAVPHPYHVTDNVWASPIGVKVQTKNWKDSDSERYGDVRHHLLERQINRGWTGGEDRSEIIHSIWKNLQNNKGYDTEYSVGGRLFPETSRDLTQNLNSLYSEVRRVSPYTASRGWYNNYWPYGSYGTDFYRRLVTCKEDYLQTEQLISDTFGRSRNFVELVYGSHGTQAQQEQRFFWPAEQAIQFARQHRHTALEL